MNIYSKKYDICKNSIPLTMEFYTDEYNNLRRLKLIILSDKLSMFDEYKCLSYDEQIEIIKKIENSCLNETLRKAIGYVVKCTWKNSQFVNIYHSICYNIISNIDFESEDSKYLIQKIINKKIDLNSIANLSQKELHPEKYENLTKEITRRANTECAIKYTELHFCKKCKRNKTTSERVQARSNDEGSSFHITCLFCDNRWIK